MQSVDRDAALTDADVALIRRARRGDGAAGERLAERLLAVPRMLAAINSMRGGRLSNHDLEDLAQDVLALVWRKLDEFQGGGRLEGWLYRFCALEHWNRLRRARRMEPCLSQEALDPGTSAPAPALSAGEIEALLEELGPPEADVVRLKHLEERSFTEIAQSLRMSPNTAKSRYYRGIRWLRARLHARVEEMH